MINSNDIIYPNNFNKLDKDIQEDIADTLNIFSFEYYCGSCDNFDSSNCPFFGQVYPGTEWENIGCNNFCD